MGKYLQLIKITFQEYFVYRLNFVFWRFRSLVFFLSLFFFWLAIYGNRTEFLGYQKAQMLTYVIGVAFLRSIVTAGRSTDLEADIYSGKVSTFLLRPWSLRKYYFNRDLVDKFLNLVFVFVEIGLVLWLLKPSFWFPQNVSTYFLFAVLSVLSLFLFFFLNLIGACLAFWTGQIWAPRWLMMIVLFEFMSGAIFPIDILPNWLAKIIMMTPFPYLIYFPLKVWLEQVAAAEILGVMVMMIFWVGAVFGISQVIWKKGFQRYSAWGG